MMELTAFDKALLNLLQGSLPIGKRPFAKMAEELGTDEERVISRLRLLKDEGFLRRIGTFFDSSRLGYGGTLVALRVAEGKVASVAEAVNRYPGVTHNYEREGKFNLWFTLLTPNLETEKEILSEVEALPGVERLLNLKTTKKYKINVQFQLS
ncbi:MAG: Lrp/AsnC family transcriptional regulator [Mitsuokella sp.]